MGHTQHFLRVYHLFNKLQFFIVTKAKLHQMGIFYLLNNVEVAAASKSIHGMTEARKTSESPWQQRSEWVQILGS